MKHITSLQVKQDNGSFTSYPLGLIERVTGAAPSSLKADGWQTGSGNYYIDVVVPNYDKKRLAVIYFDIDDDNVKSEILTCSITVSGTSEDKIKFKALKKPTVEIQFVMLLGDKVDEETEPIIIPPNGVTEETIVKALGFEPVDGRNLFVMKTASGGYLDGGSGEVIGGYVPISFNLTSDYIEVTSGQKFMIQWWGTPVENTTWTYWMTCVFYDAEKSILKKTIVNGGKDFSKWTFMYVPWLIEIPDDAVYMRVSARMYSDGKIKVERGSTATDWSPAPEDIVTKIPEDVVEALGYVPGYGVNLLTGTRQNDKTTMIDWTGGFVTYYKDGDFGTVKVTGKNNNGAAFMSVYYPTIVKLSTTAESAINTDFIKGKYIFSCEYKTNYGFPSPQLRVFDKNSGHYENVGPTMLAKSIEMSGVVNDEQWHNIKVILDFNNEWLSATKPNMNDGIICYGFTPSNMSLSQYFEIKKPKLEFYNIIDSNWTSSPEDTGIYVQDGYKLVIGPR